MVIHTVRPGDSVYTIARRYGVTPSVIIRDNRLENPDRLVVGQVLTIATESQRHTVEAGESLFSIAQQYGITLDQLLAANPSLTSPYVIQPGQVLVIPSPDQNLGNIDVNGYCYPNINSAVLADTLPHLTYLSIFSYNVRPDGSLVDINDAPLISAARQQRVAPMMVITNILEGGSFDSDLGHTILTDQQVQNTLIENIMQNLRAKNYYGLDVDFEYLYPADRENYNRFLERLGTRLREENYILTAAVAPKISADQPGTLYEAHDYPFIGRVCDHVIIMTYEWGYTYGYA